MRYLCALLCVLPLAAADIAVAPQSLTFYYQYYSGVVVQQGIAISSPQPLPFTATRPPGDSWLLLPVNAQAANAATYSDTGPMILPVSVDPTVLGLGTYKSAITLKFSQGAITVPVTLIVTASVVMVTSPAVVFFDPTASVQTVYVGLSNPYENFLLNKSTATPWLGVSGLTSPVYVTAASGKAPPGVSVGSVQLRSSSLLAVLNNPLNLPVVYLSASLASRGPLTMAPSSLSFAGAGAQQVAVTGGDFTAASDSSWLATAVSGSTLTVTANAAGLAAGSYQGTVTLASGGVLQMLPVMLTVGAAAPPNLGGLANSASYASGGIAPGEILVLGGTALGPGTLAGLTLDASGRVATALGGTQVTFNGVAAPLVYASATQVAAVAPYELDGASSADVVVTFNGQASNTLTVPVVAAAPGIFTANASGTGPGAILNSDYSVNGPDHPAAKGETVSVYMTGEGQTNPGGVNGKVTATPPVPRQSVTATIDGQPAQVTFAGEAPGLVSGVMQVNVQVPASARSGNLTLVVTVGGVPSQNGVTVSVR